MNTTEQKKQLEDLERIRLRQLASGAQNWAKRTEEKINMILSNNLQ